MIRTLRTDAEFLTALDKLLQIICQKLQLTKTQYRLAEEHYRAVGRWLEQEGSILAPYRPIIYPQGSLPMGTTNKPLSREEYDLDFVCELLIDWRRTNPIDLLSKVEFRLREHDDYRSRIERKNRCVSLKYAHDFHLDIVAACSNSALGEGQIRVPDRELKSWRDSNSKQYIAWFDRIAETYAVSARCLDHAEPLPQQESLEEKAPLRCAIQLMKRCRDLTFTGEKSGLAPASILLSTLCAECYQGQESVSEAIFGILQGICYRIANTKGRLQVWNQANQVLEDLGERWDRNPCAYQEFVIWIGEFSRLWEQLMNTRGHAAIAGILAILFEENLTQAAMRDSANWVDQGRLAGQLGMVPKTGALTNRPCPIVVPKNTFYGD
ncbi:MAG: nucleotidyltransferase [Leptolyngbya sp. Prado105]|jgi:hypothetical protein|nr:nucleotidyltransferase [Leptolyngbya sp. Prado105]